MRATIFIARPAFSVTVAGLGGRRPLGTQSSTGLVPDIGLKYCGSIPGFYAAEWDKGGMRGGLRLHKTHQN